MTRHMRGTRSRAPKQSVQLMRSCFGYLYRIKGIVFRALRDNPILAALIDQKENLKRKPKGRRAKEN